MCVCVQQCIESAPLFPVVSDGAGSSRQTGNSPPSNNEQQSLVVKSEIDYIQAGPSQESEPQPGFVITFYDILRVHSPHLQWYMQ